MLSSALLLPFPNVANRRPQLAAVCVCWLAPHALPIPHIATVHRDRRRSRSREDRRRDDRERERERDRRRDDRGRDDGDRRRRERSPSPGGRKGDKRARQEEPMDEIAQANALRASLGLKPLK